MPPIRSFLLVCAALSMTGCAFFKSAKNPMPAERFQPLGPEKAKGVVVFLPGFSDGPEDFVENGFVEIVRERAPGYDMVATDAHFAYYRERILFDRLEADIIEPLRREGYREVWLVGISMGGLGSLGYTYTHPDHVSGLILLAPYLGPRELIEEIDAAGGLAAWEPGEVEAIEDEEQRLYRGIWAWLKQREADPNPAHTVYLGYGTEDSLRFPNALLGSSLSDAQVETREGGHTWTVWTPLMRTLAGRALGAGDGAEATDPAPVSAD